MSDNSDIAVRPAEAAHAEAIATLCGQLGYPSTGEQIGRRLTEIADDAAAVLVADSHPA